MKLFEILRPVIDSRRMKTSFDVNRLDREARQVADNDEGQGAYATVKPNPRDPHEVRKVSRMPSDLSKDGYYQFVQSIQSHMKDNPFLPRVYKIGLRIDKTNRTRPSYRIEKLTPYTEYSSKALIAVGDKCFSEFSAAFAKYKQNNRPANQEFSFPMADNALVWKFLCTKIYELSMYGEARGVGEPNPKLEQAMELVQRVLDKGYPFSNDMHINNFMIRGTSTGPQLVLTDPIGDGGNSVIGGRGAFGADEEYDTDVPF